MNLAARAATPRQRERWAAAFIALLVLGVALGFALWLWGVHQRARAALEQIEPRYARVAGLLQSQEQLAQARRALQADLALYVYPPDADAGQVGNRVLQRVRELAGEQQLRVTSSQVGTPQPDREQAAFERIALSLRVEGDWAGVQSLLRALPAQRPMIFAQVVQMQQQGYARPEQPQPVQVQLDLFVLRERAP